MFEKKNGKRFLASVMALVMLLSLAPVGALAVEDEEQNQEVVALPANEANPKPVVTDEGNTANTNEEPTPPPRNEGIATLPANNNNTPVALPETPVIVKPAEGLIDEAFGVDANTSKDNGIAEYGNNDYKARTVKVAVYATDGSDEHSKVNTDIAKLLGIPCKQEDGYYPIGVIEIPKSLVTGRTPYINTEEDWEAVKAAIEKIDTSWLTNNTRENIDNVAGSKNKENTISKNLDKVQVDLKHEAGSHKTALFTWNGDSQNIKGNYDYHLDLRFATVTLKFVGVIKGAPQNIDMGNRIYLTNTEILEPGTSDDFYLTGIPNGYQINGYYSDEDLDTVYTFDNKKATADDTIYVELVQKPVKITYNLNGGNLNGETESVVYNNLHVGDTMLTPNDPECEGYTFKGWKDKDGKSLSQQVTGDATYFAQWERIPDPEPVQSTDVYVYFRVVNTNDENVSIDGLSVKYNANAGGNTWCTFGKISTTKELTLNNVKKDAETQLTSTNAQIHTDNAAIKDKVLRNVTWYQLGTWEGAPGYYDSGTYWHLDGKITGYTVTYASEGTPQNMPQNDGKYYLNNTTYTISNTVPTRAGYTFAGWKSNITNDNKTYKADGENTSITIPKQNVVLTAQWTRATNLSYTVNYLEKGTNKVLHAPKTESDKTFENTITATDEVIDIDGYTYNSADKDILTIGTSGNVINLYYVKRTDLSYTVNYLEKGTNEVVKTAKTANNQTFGTQITATSEAVEIDGYTYVEADKPALTIGTSENVINLYYTKRNDLSYTVNYLEKNTNEVVKTAKTANNQTFGTQIAATSEAVEIDGYTYVEADKPTLTIGTGENVINLYYTKATQYKIIIHYVDDAQTPTTLQKDTVIEGKYENNSYDVNDKIPARIGDYVKESVTGNVEGTVGTSDVIITVVYTKDVLVDPTVPKTNDPGDNIPDKYQVIVKYVPDTTGRGTVGQLTEEVLTIYRDSEKKGYASEGQVTATGSIATVTGNRCYFSKWTTNATVDTSKEPATLGKKTFNAKGGETYTFTANFGYSGGGGSGGSSRPSTPPTVDIPDDVPTGLNGKDHYAYIIGYGNNDVRPQNNITRAEVATIFFRLLTDETREANMTKSNGYNDVKDGDWFCCAVSTLSKMGIIKGYEDGSFKPNDPISRAEFAAIAARFDPDGDKTPASFSDVTSHWAKDEISIAANHGWIKGYEDGSFKPDQKITRAETMTLVNRVLNRLPEAKDDLHKDMKTWVDNMDETAWYYLAVQEATNSHYFKNKTGTKFEQWTDLRDTRDWSELEK